MPRNIIGTFQNVRDRCSLLFSYPPAMPMSSPHDGKVMGAKKQFDPFQFSSADPHIGLSSEQTRSSEKTRRLGLRLAAFIGYGGFYMPDSAESDLIDRMSYHTKTYHYIFIFTFLLRFAIIYGSKF